MALAIVVLAIALSGARGTLLAWGGRVGAIGLRSVAVVGVFLIAVKLVLAMAAPDAGFAACYRNPIAPRAGGGCELSFDQPFGGASTRIDREIDFGPRGDSAERALLTASDWELSFVNETRLNIYAVPGEIDVRRLPIRVDWRGPIDARPGDVVPIRYVGEGRVILGGRSTRLPASYDEPETVYARVGAGDNDLALTFRFLDTVEVGSDRDLGPYATLRVAEARPSPDGQFGDPLHVPSPDIGWVLLGGVADLLLLGFVAVCTAALVSAWLRARRVAVVVVVVGGALALLSAGRAGFAPLDLPFAPLVLGLVVLLVVSTWAGPEWLLPIGVPAAIAVSIERVLSSVPGIHSVVFRERGSDWQTYQSFARSILEQRSLEGGESVFYYQPGIRYWAFAQHLLLGDGDALPAVLALALLLVSVLVLVRAATGRSVTGATIARVPRATRLVVAGGGAALLLVFTAPPVVSLVVVGASEVPTWFVIPVLLPLLFTRASPWRWYGGAVLLGATFVFRPNQGVAALALLAVFVAVHHRTALRRVVTVVATCVGVMLLPLLHNLVYAGRFVLLPTGANTVEDLPPARLLHLFDDPSVRRILRDKLAALLYLTPRSGRDAMLGLAIFGVQVLFLAVVVRTYRRRRTIPGVGGAWLLLAWPLAFALPSVSYDLFVYYPRHIMAMYVALASAAVFVEARYVARAEPSVTRSPSSKVIAGT